MKPKERIFHLSVNSKPTNEHEKEREIIITVFLPSFPTHSTPQPIHAKEKMPKAP